MFKCLFLYIFHNGNEKRSLKKTSKYVVYQIIQTCDKRKTNTTHTNSTCKSWTRTNYNYCEEVLDTLNFTNHWTTKF